MSTTYAAYREALDADNAMSVQIHETTQGQRNRWTYTAADLLDSKLRDAIARKLNADAAFRLFFGGKS